MPTDIDDRPEAVALLRAVKRDHDVLTALLARHSSEAGYDDPIYRLYHQSWKVLFLQDSTLAIVDALRALAPDRPLNPWFAQIIEDGTTTHEVPSTQDEWLSATRPVAEAFFHARYFLEMAVRCGRELDAPPQLLPSSWAALLTLFGLR